MKRQKNICHFCKQNFILQISNSNNNQAERFVTERVIGQTIEKPLMFFCFDHLDGKTVALTCPKRELMKPIAKCDSENGFKAFPINGYLFEKESMNQQFKYDEKKVNRTKSNHLNFKPSRA